MRGLEKSLLAGIILIVAVCAVGGILLLPVAGFNFTNYFGLQPILGTATTPSLADIVTPTPGTNIEGVSNIVTSPGDQNQPSEVECSIANDVYNDFSVNGLSGSASGSSNSRRTTYSGGGQNYITSFDFWGTSQEMDLVGYKTFILNDNRYDQSWDSLYSAAGCKQCSSNTNFKLDEVCINYDLQGKTVPESGGPAFCTGPTSAGGVKFGNNKCASISNTEFGQCSDCDNGVDLIMWAADNADNQQSATSIGPAQLIADQNDFNNNNAWELNKHQNYMYGLVWATIKQKYYLYFERIPSLTQSSSFDFLKTIYNGGMSDVYYRSNMLGYWRQEARMIADVIVTPTSEKYVSDILSDISTASGLSTQSGGVTLTPCSGDCITTELNGGESSDEKCGTSTNQGYCGVQCALHEKPIEIISPLALTDSLQVGHHYRVMVMNWFGEYNKKSTEYLDYQCFNQWDRTVSITEVTPVTITIGTTTTGGQMCATVGLNGQCTTSSQTLTFYSGDTVTLTAVPAAGYKIDSFLGDNSKSYTPSQLGCPTDTTQPCSVTRTLTSSPTSSTLKVVFASI